MWTGKYVEQLPDGKWGVFQVEPERLLSKHDGEEEAERERSIPLPEPQDTTDYGYISHAGQQVNGMF